jgi:hypothetical protein
MASMCTLAQMTHRAGRGMAQHEHEAHATRGTSQEHEPHPNRVHNHTQSCCNTSAHPYTRMASMCTLAQMTHRAGRGSTRMAKHEHEAHATRGTSQEHEPHPSRVHNHTQSCCNTSAHHIAAVYATVRRMSGAGWGTNHMDSTRETGMDGTRVNHREHMLTHRHGPGCTMLRRSYTRAHKWH